VPPLLGGSGIVQDPSVAEMARREAWPRNLREQHRREPALACLRSIRCCSAVVVWVRNMRKTVVKCLLSDTRSDEPIGSSSPTQRSL